MATLKKSRDKKIAGVCGGVANYLGIDPTIMRIIWLCAVFFAGTGVILYLIAWLIMPD